jgi:hypothetical protein
VTTTPSRFRDFGSSQILDTSEYEPVSFKLDGETFTCHSVIPGAALLDFVAAADSGEGGRASESIMRFFAAALPREEYERFEVFVGRTDRVTPLETLAEISAWLVEIYSERPTRLPSVSPDGISATAPTSEVPVSSEASIQSV